MRRARGLLLRPPVSRERCSFCGRIPSIESFFLSERCFRIEVQLGRLEIKFSRFDEKDVFESILLNAFEANVYVLRFRLYFLNTLGVYECVQRLNMNCFYLGRN